MKASPSRAAMGVDFVNFSLFDGVALEYANGGTST
jgi:hypothetical protein